MKTIDLARFNMQQVQSGVSFCIPACIHMSFRYHDSNCPHSQEYLLGLMVTGSRDHQPSFGAAAQFVGPVVQNQFQLNVLTPASFQEWSDNIKREIDLGNPIAIATRVSPTNVHIRLVLGYDDTAKQFLLYNPGGFNIQANVHNNQTAPGATLVIRSFAEYYNYQDAANHFSTLGSSTDQLSIHLI